MMSRGRRTPPVPAGRTQLALIQGGFGALNGPLVSPSGPSESEDRPPEIGDMLFRGPVSTCDPAWYSIRCKCGVNRVKMGSCQKEACTVCSSRVAARRTKRTASRFVKRGAGQALCYTTFTVPPDLRHLCTQAAWKRLRKALMAVLKEKYAFLWGCESSHPTGDDVDVFHPHMNVLWIRRPPAMGTMPAWQLDQLKADWRSIIGNVLDVEPPDVATAFHCFKTGRDKQAVAGLVYYVMRAFPGWSHWTGMRVRWYRAKGFDGKPIRLPRADKEPWECPHCHEPFAVRFVGDVDGADSVLTLSRTASLSQRARDPP